MYVYPPHLVTANNQIVRLKTQRNRLLIELLIETNKRVSIDNNNMYNKPKTMEIMKILRKTYIFT